MFPNNYYLHVSLFICFMWLCHLLCIFTLHNCPLWDEQNIIEFNSSVKFRVQKKASCLHAFFNIFSVALLSVPYSTPFFSLIKKQCLRLSVWHLHHCWWPPCRWQWTYRWRRVTSWGTAARNAHGPSLEPHSSVGASVGQLDEETNKEMINSQGIFVVVLWEDSYVTLHPWQRCILKHNTHLDVWCCSWVPAWCSGLQDKIQEWRISV